MVNQVCFSSNTFLVFMMFNIAIIFWVLYTSYQTNLENQNLKQTSLMHESENTRKEAELHQIEQLISARISDEPPQIPVNYGLPVNIPTRGPPSNFYIIGYVYRKNDPNLTMRLLERYLQGGRYEYCAVHHNNESIMIPVYTHNYEQLSDGDRVKIRGYKGHFTTSLFQ